MTTPHRTLQMALDALDAITDDVDGTGLNTMPSFDKALDAIAALREALNAPEPEPVAWYYVEDPWGANEWHFMTDSPESQECDPRDWTPLYAAPPAAPAPAAPVPDGMVPNAGEVICPNCAHQFRAIPENVQSLLLASGHEPPFTASPAAPVVPLTDEQIRTMWKSSEFRGNGGQVDWFCEGIRAAEAHHGITGGKP